MKAWTKEEALKTLNELLKEIDHLESSRAFSTEHTKWIVKCLETFEEVFGPTSRYYLTFANLEWRKTGSSIIEAHKYGWDYGAAIDATHHQAYLNHLRAAKGLLLAAIDYLKDRDIKDVYTTRESGNEASLVLKVLNLAEQKLRKVIRDKPEKEKQVQDDFESLLVGADIPYGREVDSIEYSSKTYNPDFSLVNISLAVEVKLCGREGREKELPAEINDDILAYKTKYQNLIFIVYDLGFIRDMDRFCSSFEEHGNVTVRVVKH